MWTYKFSDGYECKRKFKYKDDMIFDIATMIRFHYKSYEPDIHADILIYKDEKLDEIVNGEDIE